MGYSFQLGLSEDIRMIKSSRNVFDFAKKTNNIYLILITYNVNKTYQKAPPRLEASINLEAKSLFTKLEISDRVERILSRPFFLMLKDHKDKFR